MTEIRVIGAGLAGCEAACMLADAGYRVILYEQKPVHFSPAHKSEKFAELVCSNSFKADRVDSASGLLKAEMRMLGSVCLKVADGCRVPAGGALAVDRELFSQGVTDEVRARENIEIRNEEFSSIDLSIPTIIATGPLTEGGLAQEISRLTGGDSLYFFDAAAPIVTRDSLNMEHLYSMSRYGQGGDDYLNAFFDKAGYDRFVGELVNAECAELHAFEEQPVYEGCMPIEKLAKRGHDAIRYGPMKPVGLRNPETGHRPWAAVQLRREDEEGTMFNLVGFQTNLKFGEQKRVFSMIPGLENAEFARYGVMHRNSFLNAPEVLDGTLRIKGTENIYIAGQLSGTEGYMESAGCGLIAARFLLARLRGSEPAPLPETTMLGALMRYLNTPNKDFQPMGANMGILPGLKDEIRDKKERYAGYASRALDALKGYLEENQ
ncbi:MAG: methylenetetrahydrofolate--tRNA-(uracil(54)-C(5))-methyltransferase (FADH(2)-oxidizing) TrmFO [Oscillospiraceae bacterium]|nr:methylenetetrahydrofolate--tRNA-(uracil(54)-C(5))-methyltransferase (FADH(2)-oxidizing) TrmFO [Oscillospiraceae bacterium]MBQ5412106.1 methylenetetrahydrofolate--tRNA-(uracil(54)-C(5))-methyltransferase (FADH(2)-oxidizing) TrmFO [Oscillospiraceae bacterium]